MSSDVRLTASVDFPASLRTSPATTAKPFPDSPAWAASTAALRASILVWNAISSIVLLMALICSVFSLISPTARSISSICRLLTSTCFPALAVKRRAASILAAVSCTWNDISFMADASSSMEPACSAAPSESIWALSDTWADPLNT